MENKRGRLIVFEGGDRTGKTTQTKLLVNFLADKKIPSERMVFPDRSTGIGRVLDSYLTSSEEVDEHAIHLLFVANRWEKAPLIIAMLDKGKTVVLDRYSFSGVAYSPGLDFGWCLSCEEGLPKPDLIFYLSMPAGAETRPGFGDERHESAEFQSKVAAVYEKLRTPAWKVVYLFFLFFFLISV